MKLKRPRFSRSILPTLPDLLPDALARSLCVVPRASLTTGQSLACPAQRHSRTQPPCILVLLFYLNFEKSNSIFTLQLLFFPKCNLSVTHTSSKLSSYYTEIYPSIYPPDSPRIKRQSSETTLTPAGKGTHPSLLGVVMWLPGQSPGEGEHGSAPPCCCWGLTGG